MVSLTMVTKLYFTSLGLKIRSALGICVTSLPKTHAHLLCIIPMLAYGAAKTSNIEIYHKELMQPKMYT